MKKFILFLSMFLVSLVMGIVDRNSATAQTYNPDGEYTESYWTYEDPCYKYYAGCGAVSEKCGYTPSVHCDVSDQYPCSILCRA